MTTKVMPASEDVGDKGTIWEALLSDQGWNDLSDEEKPGYIYRTLQLPDNVIVCDVYWPKLNYASYNVFPDELVIAT